MPFNNTKFSITYNVASGRFFISSWPNSFRYLTFSSNFIFHLICSNALSYAGGLESSISILRNNSSYPLDSANFIAKSVLPLALHSLIAVSISNKSDSKLEPLINSSNLSIYFCFT
jgi:hypothetical protein